MEVLNINWARMNAEGFYLGKTPKNLLYFINSMLEKKEQEKHLSVIDRHEYLIIQYENAFKIKFFKNGVIEKLWFINKAYALNKCWKEIS